MADPRPGCPYWELGSTKAAEASSEPYPVTVDAVGISRPTLASRVLILHWARRLPSIAHSAFPVQCHGRKGLASPPYITLSLFDRLVQSRRTEPRESPLIGFVLSGLAACPDHVAWDDARSAASTEYLHGEKIPKFRRRFGAWLGEEIDTA